MNILLYDIETAPSLAHVWAHYETNVLDYEYEWYILSFAYKWLGKPVKAYSLPDFKLYKKDDQNDKDLVVKLHDLMSEADVVIAHNGIDFDNKKSNARFIAHNLLPPSPYKSVDTLRIARKYFAFQSNKLNDLCQHLGLGKKVSTGGYELWQGCMKGDKKAWSKMVRYNKNDVILLEKLYLKLLPWIENHPNVNVLSDVPNACPNCGSIRLHHKGYGINMVGKYARFQCQDCGKWGKGKPIKTSVNIR